jgi:hypothetical protein
MRCGGNAGRAVVKSVDGAAKDVTTDVNRCQRAFPLVQMTRMCPPGVGVDVEAIDLFDAQGLAETGVDRVARAELQAVKDARVHTPSDVIFPSCTR